MSEGEFLQAPLLEERRSLCQGRAFVSQNCLCTSAQTLFPCSLTAVSGRMILAGVTCFCCNQNISHSRQGNCKVLFLCIPLPQPEAVQPTPHPWGDPAVTPVACLDSHVLRSFGSQPTPYFTLSTLLPSRDGASQTGACLPSQSCIT